MPYYHVIINQKSDRYYSENKTDLSLDQLTERFIDPYEQGNPIIVNGKTINLVDIKRISVYLSHYPIDHYIREVEDQQSNSLVNVIGGLSYTQIAIQKTTNVTDQFITMPPGQKAKLKAENPTSVAVGRSDFTKVFIVHGHDETAQTKAARFVEKLGLKAIILHEQASAGRTIIEKIEHYSDVDFALVLYTPDDVGHVKGKPENLSLRARQNVIFEHGYLIGKLSRKNVVALVDG